MIEWKYQRRHLPPHLFLQNNNGKLYFTRKVRKRFTYKDNLWCIMWKICLYIWVVASNNLYGSSPLFSFAQCGEDEVVWEKLPKCANSKCWTHRGWKMVESGEKCTDWGCTDSIAHFLSRITYSSSEIELCRTPLLCHYHSLETTLIENWDKRHIQQYFLRLICNFSAAFLSFFLALF